MHAKNVVLQKIQNCDTSEWRNIPIPVLDSLMDIREVILKESHSVIKCEDNVGQMAEVLETMFKYIDEHVKDMRYGILDRFCLLNDKSEDELK